MYILRQLCDYEKTLRDELANKRLHQTSFSKMRLDIFKLQIENQMAIVI